MTEIRPLAQEDQDEWRRLWTLYLEFYESSVEEAVYQTTWRRLMSGDAGEFKGLAAVAEGRLIGITHYLFHRHCWRLENVIYLQDLYVDETVRGTGAGRALIEGVYAAADAAGCPNVYWLTQDFNTTARQLYDRVATKSPFIKYTR